MKIPIIIALVVALFNELHCAPVRDDEGYYKEGHSLNRWGRHYGGGFNLGIHGGVKDGLASLGTTNNFDFNADGYDGTDRRDVYYTINAQPAPSNSGNRYNPGYSSPYGEYTPQYGQQFSQQYSQNRPGFEPQYEAQYPQRAPPRRRAGSRRPPTDSQRYQRREEEEEEEA
ncbi:uncharacterized protein LOC111349307 [Spodoptera litura]|uniref:Uncharacterized protein LOC111349307 n=1 Tax=Spodoptera litura TaxID=69820 RepID=A0A9J7IM82_SPOLT|nr:uncharacterized protein LOC111349307 [Spodoptera litura]